MAASNTRGGFKTPGSPSRPTRGAGLGGAAEPVHRPLPRRVHRRMDADDIAYPDRLERQVRSSNRIRYRSAGSQMLIFGEDGAALGKRALPCDHQGIVANPAVSFGIGHPTWMGRSAWFRRYRYNPMAVRYEDVELLYRAYRESRFANLPEILHAYREPMAAGPNASRRGSRGSVSCGSRARIRVPSRPGGAGQSCDGCGDCGLRPALRHVEGPRAAPRPGRDCPLAELWASAWKRRWQADAHRDRHHRA